MPAVDAPRRIIGSLSMTCPSQLVSVAEVGKNDSPAFSPRSPSRSACWLYRGGCVSSSPSPAYPSALTPVLDNAERPLSHAQYQGTAVCSVGTMVAWWCLQQAGLARAASTQAKIRVCPPCGIREAVHGAPNHHHTKEGSFTWRCSWRRPNRAGWRAAERRATAAHDTGVVA